MPMKYCYHCGKSLADDFLFCPGCGSAALYSPASAPTEEPCSVGAKVMGFVSMGLGIPSTFMSIANTLLILAGLIQSSEGGDPDLFGGFLFFAMFTLIFAVPAVILGTLSMKRDFRGSSATVGRAFGIMGAITATIVIVLGFINL